MRLDHLLSKENIVSLFCHWWVLVSTWLVAEFFRHCLVLVSAWWWRFLFSGEKRLARGFMRVWGDQ